MAGSIPDHERQPFMSEACTSVLTEYGSASDAVSPPTLPKQLPKSSDAKSRGWGRVREIVNTGELFIRNTSELPESEDSNDYSTKHHRWSDIGSMSYDITHRECLIIFFTLLTVGVLAYSFLFEQWSIIDSLYFTTVLLTTVGYGDIAPESNGGKLFASVFALAGVVLLGCALGVVGGEIVEIEIEYTKNISAALSKALEHSFTGRSRHKQAEEDTIAHGSMRMHSSSKTITTRPKSIYEQREQEREEAKKCNYFPGLSVMHRHLPGFAPMLIGGIAMALLNGWGVIDFIYYFVVTATTIGFGDLTPRSDTSKAIAIVFVPVSVASMGYILGNFTSFLSERRRAKYTKKLWASELKLEDIEVLDENSDGAVSELEYIKFMLVAMRKIDGELFDDLRDQFIRLDVTGDGKVTKADLKIIASRNIRSWSHKLLMGEYKHQLMNSYNEERNK